MDHDDGTLFDLPDTPATARAAHSSPHTAAFPFAAPSCIEELVEQGWGRALAPSGAVFHGLAESLAGEIERGHRVLPDAAHILRAFSSPLEKVRVVIVGQDPYPTPGHAVGLSFATDPATAPIPRSLANIFRELAGDIGCPQPATGDLSGWSEQGVLLLNRVLTVRAGDAASHRGLGWEGITDAAITALVARGLPLVAILWGRDAARLKPLLGSTSIIESVHPSPLSAARGFFGSRPFSRANELLEQQGAEPVDWARTAPGASS